MSANGRRNALFGGRRTHSRRFLVHVVIESLALYNKSYRHRWMLWMVKSRAISIMHNANLNIFTGINGTVGVSHTMPIRVWIIRACIRPGAGSSHWSSRVTWRATVKYWLSQCCRDAFKIIRGRGPCEEIDSKGKWRKERFLSTHHRSSIMSQHVNNQPVVPHIVLTTESQPLANFLHHTR